MNILGIGIDLVENQRIASSIEKFGDRFLTRIYRDSELAYCQSKADPVPHLAARFAAKEALSKALGTGIGEQIGWLDIEVIRALNGSPSIVLHGKAAAYAETRHVSKIFLSLTHTHAYAAAYVTIVAE